MASTLANTWKKAKNIPKNWWKNSVEEAPPAMRDVTIAYAPLERVIAGNRKTGQIFEKVPVGSYVPEAKMLAQAGELKAQIEEKIWAKARKEEGKSTSYAHLKNERSDLALALYWPNGKRKTAFELAIVPSFSKGPVQKMMEREYKYRRDHQLPFPQLVSKYRIGPDFLKDIGKVGLVLKEYPTGFKINIKNPSHKMTLREKLLHYTGQWAALILTVLGAVTIGVTNPWLFAAGAGGLYLANKTGRDFGLYDVAETLHRDFGVLSSKKFGWTGKFSLAKTAETCVYLAALAFVGFLAVSGAWTGALALPCWSWLAANGVGLVAVEAMQFAAAGFLGLVAAVSTYAAVTFPVRYFWGLSFFDNQEHPSKKEVDHLPVINVKKDLQSSLERKCQEVIGKIAKPEYGISSKDRKDLGKTICSQFEVLIKKASKAEKAANDHQTQNDTKRKLRSHKK